jgi:ABC-type sugar transport system, permease component
MKSRENKSFKAISFIVLILASLCCLIPFLIVISNSFSSEESILRNGFSLIPSQFSLEAYKMLFKYPQNIIDAYRTTIIVTAVGTIVSLFLTAMTAYVLSRPDFKWRNGFSFFFYFTMLFNGGLVPWYILCQHYLDFGNHAYIAMIVPYLFSVFNLLVLKSFLREVPESIVESARIDGANNFTIFIRLVIPLSKPALATIGLFTALSYWNDWYLCYLFVSDPKYNSLQYYLYRTLNSESVLQQLTASSGINMGNSILPTESMKMAMVLIAIGPILLVYPFVQKYFVRGLTIGGVKG